MPKTRIRRDQVEVLCRMVINDAFEALADSDGATGSVIF
jgi:hypothetical protein